MKQRILIVGAVLGWMACGKLFSIRIGDESTTTIERGTLFEEFIGDMGYSEFTAMDLTQSAELENQGVAPGDISEVYMELLELEVAGPSGADLSFIDSVELYVEAPNLPRLLVASQDDFPAGETLVAFDLEDVDLTDYVVSERMTFDTDMAGNRPDVDTDVTALFELKVGVTGQGACNATKR